jgi:opacity protein-like surface antigen
MTYLNRAISIVSVLLMMTAMNASAQEGTTWFGDSADGQWLIGIKGGIIQNDDPSFSDADNIGLVLGYQFAREIGTNGSASVELEYSETDDATINASTSGHWNTDSLGLFMNYRGPGTVYFKGKLGVMRTDVQATTGGVQLPKVSDTNFAYGLGLGVALGATQNFKIEADWTGTSGDNDLNLFSIGGLLFF